MKSLARISRHLRTVSLLVAGWVVAVPGFAQSEPAAPDALADGLRVELSTPRGLHSPTRPIWVRVTLHNTSEQAVEIPLQAAPESNDGIALPLEIVFGTIDEPALFVAYQAEKPVAVQPPAPAKPTENQAAALRLAPHGSVGTAVDLREYFPALRYCGAYRVEWRPLGGGGGSSSVEFRVEPRKDVILITDKVGKVTFTLMYDEAPHNVADFLELVREGFYDGKTFHRVIPGFLIQGGCPKGDGTGLRPDGKLLPAEFHGAAFRLGTLAMARKPSDPNSASCQFFVTLARLPELDGQYTVIGQASDEESIRTLTQLAAEPADRNNRPRLPLTIRSINLVDADEARVTRFDLKPTRSSTQVPNTPANKAKPDRP